MANSLNAARSTPIAGLGTFSQTVTTTAPHVVSVQSNIPLGSQLLITIQQNGSTIATQGGATNNPSPACDLLFLKVTPACTAGDVISIILSSTAAVDHPPNAVTSQINFYRGV